VNPLSFFPIARRRSSTPKFYLREIKLKQGNTTVHLLKQPQSRTLTTPNAGEYVEQEKLS